MLVGRLVTGIVLSIAAAMPIYAGGDHGHHHHQGELYKVQQLTKHIAVLQGKSGNIGVLTGAQGLVMVDDDYRSMSPALQKTLKKFGGEAKLTYIINTHWHSDHTEENHRLGHQATIIAHDKVRERLLTSQEIELFQLKTEPYPEHALPSITYEKALTLYINDEEVELLHLAGGHTDGDSIVFFKEANVVHMGDHFFNGIFPFVDVKNGGNAVQMSKNIEQVLTLINDETIVIPGHGPVCKKAGLEEFQLMLKGTLAEVQAMKVKGMTLGQMQMQGLSNRWSAWSDGFLSTGVWIKILNDSLDSSS